MSIQSVVCKQDVNESPASLTLEVRSDGLGRNESPNTPSVTKLKLHVNAVHKLYAQLHARQMTAMNYIRVGREIPDSITKYDLTEIIAVLCRKLDWVEEEPDPVEVTSRPSKCDILKKTVEAGTKADVPKTEESLSTRDKSSAFEKNSSLEAADGSEIHYIEEQKTKSIQIDPLEDKPKLATMIDDDSMDQSKTTQKDGEKLFPCAYCGKTFNLKWSRKMHERTHWDVKPYKCSYCDYRTITKKALQRHEMIHTGVKPFSCSQCYYQCHTSSDLGKHQFVHTKEKNFTCTYCSKKFKTNKNRRSHERRFHLKTNEENFKTKRNEELFDRTYTLYKQARPVKPINCPLCDKTFLRVDDLRSHRNSCITNYSKQSLLKANSSYKQQEKIEPKRQSLLKPNANNQLPGDVKTFSCSLCGKTFSQEAQYLKHVPGSIACFQEKRKHREVIG